MNEHEDSRQGVANHPATVERGESPPAEGVELWMPPPPAICLAERRWSFRLLRMLRVAMLARPTNPTLPRMILHRDILRRRSIPATRTVMKIGRLLKPYTQIRKKLRIWYRLNSRFAIFHLSSAFSFSRSDIASRCFAFKSAIALICFCLMPAIASEWRDLSSSTSVACFLST